MRRSQYRLAGRLLQVALAIMLLGSLLAQVLVRVAASQEAALFPEVAYLEVPYSAAAILFIGCGQVATVVVWRLVSLVDGNRIFTGRTLRWLDAMVACAAVAAVLGAGVMVHMLGFVPGGGGPTVFAVAGATAAALALALLVIVARGVLELAIADRAQLDAMI